MDGQFEQDSPYGLQHAVIGTVLLDSRRQVISVSADAEKLLGFPARMLVGRTLDDLHPQGTGKIDALLEKVHEGCNGSAAAMIIPVPGRLLLLKVTLLPEHYVLTLFDVLELSRRRPVATAGAGGSSPVAAGSPALTELPPAAPGLLKLPVETPAGIELIDLSQVAALHATGRYAEVKTISGRDRLCGLSLKELDERLDPSRFLRVHRAWIVNVLYARAFRRRNDLCELVMADEAETVVPIGRSRVSLVRGLLGL